MINCMNRNVLERTDSYNKASSSPKHHVRLCFLKVGRTWSGSLAPPRYVPAKDHGVVGQEKERDHPARRRRWRCNSEAGALLGADGGPSLARSLGMRRDWSFEDLQSNNKIKNAGQI
uniref:Uncharacterized protein n=1 Tax=Kalanchoe fedtschenkoi TaxID=63787 RepID=A0A7N0UZC7_KALFE